MELWRGGFFVHDTTHSHGVQCCGAALASPTFWTSTEQIMQMPNNTFVFKEEDSTYIHSGSFSARLYTNTTRIDSAGDIAGGTPVLIPGTVASAGIVGYGSMGIMGDPYQTIVYSRGQPFSDTPTALSFYMRFYHESADTALYAYVFTRWDSIAHREDTLAFHQVDIADAGLPADHWIQFSDTIHYLHRGMPDTLHMIFYGGRNGDSTKIGNTTWLDDLSFYYAGRSITGATGLVHLSADDAISIYPHPVTDRIHIRVDDYMVGYTLELFDLRGSRVIQETLAASHSSYPTASFADGCYLYRLLDRDHTPVRDGKIIIQH